MKIDHSKFKDYTLIVPGSFKATMTDYDAIRKCFNWREHATIYGNKFDGSQTLIDSK